MQASRFRKIILVVSDRDEKFVEFFRRQRVLVAGLWEEEFEAAMKAEKTSEEEQGVIYASYNEEDRTALYGAMVKLRLGKNDWKILNYRGSKRTNCSLPHEHT